MNNSVGNRSLIFEGPFNPKRVFDKGPTFKNADRQLLKNLKHSRVRYQVDERLYPGLISRFGPFDIGQTHELIIYFGTIKDFAKEFVRLDLELIQIYDVYEWFEVKKEKEDDQE